MSDDGKKESAERFAYSTQGPEGPGFLLTASTMTHAGRDGRLAMFSSEEAAWEAARKTLQHPDAIHANPDRPGLKKRKAHRRYVRYEASVKQHLIIPVQILSATDVESDRFAVFEVAPATRFANTVITSSDAPTDFIIKPPIGGWRT